MAKKELTTYKFSPGIVAPDTNLYPNAFALINSNKKYIIEEAVEYIQYNIDNDIPPFVFYTYNTEKCRRDLSYVIEGYLSDLRHGGNRVTVNNAAKYFENGFPQIDGSRDPEVATHTFVRNLITNYILTNTAFTSLQVDISQVIDLSNPAEGAATARITTLANIIIDVIDVGVSQLPALESNRGFVKFPGYYKLKDILLINNATRNQLLYNFVDPTTAIDLTYSENFDADFPGALFGAEKITTITFDVDTTNMMVTDNIQIFVEAKEQTVRLNPIGTDAMERTKVGIPQSMLDADFEYGLQPTKWQALSLMRNYPAVYEIPGSEIAVTSVITDASSATGGTGSSLITVTTVASHQLTVDTPITIKALANSVSGFSRAEGSFLVNTVPSTTTFTYYAKSKVGVTNGEQLSSTYTQLRKAAYYTGAAVGSPTFSVFSNGSSGTITTSLTTASGRDIIGFTGTAPTLGAPLSGTGIESGTQITAVAGSGGTVLTTTLTTTAFIGQTVLVVDDTTGLGPGLLIDRGDGVGVTITDVTGNNVTISGPLTSNITGSIQSYGPLSSNSTTSAAGNGATITISRNGASYSASVIFPGQLYINGDTLTFNGVNLGGTTPANNAVVTITSASPIDSVASLDNGTLVSGLGYSDATGAATSGGTGSGLTLDTTTSSGSITSVSINNAGTGYTIGDTISIPQTLGRVLSRSFSGPAGTGYTTATGVATSGGTGSGLTVDIIDDGAGQVASVQINNPGSGYTANDVITISGGNNDATLIATTVSTLATIEVATVTTGGVIQSVSVAGTPISAGTVNFISAITINTPTTLQINSGSSLTFSAIGTIEINFLSAHGFVPGDTITVQISSSGSNAQLAAGPFFVEQVPTSTSLRYTARSAGTIANTLVGIVYARPDSYFIHRPFDGGVQLGTGGSGHGASAIRMSKKYIRYQSGKGCMYNTGALFAPSYDIRSLTATGTTVGSVITLTTDDTDHGCQVGAQIQISGVTTGGYNGVYTVTDVSTERILSVIAYQTLANAVAVLGSPCQMAVRQWHGSTVRAGIFDDQNGMFYQYDGKTLAVVKRSSTFQLAGVVQLQVNSNNVTGVNTRFTEQLKAGDRVVMRGMSHTVTQIINDTSMTVAPDFRGVNNVSEVKICKTQDLIVPQEYWNGDPCNGSGPSGYNIDITKMQMIGIQHTWYGAGFIDFMLRGPDGNYIFVHRFRNSNVNTEAYMRTGNQPVRYEVINEGARGQLTASMDNSQTTVPMTASDLYYFPQAGTVLIDNELIRFTGNSGTALTGCTRAAALTQFAAGSQRNFTAGAAANHQSRAGVILVSNTVTPIISHWGSAYMIDGLFDSDRGYLFNYAATAVSASTSKRTSFLIRLAPSVSNAQVGDLGDKELLNRAQLLLSSISVTSDTVTGGGALVIEGILNPSNYPVDPTLITWNGLSSAASGGQPSFAQIASGGSVTWSGGTTTSTATVQGAFTTTITAKSFNAASQTITAISFSPITYSLTARALLFSGSTYRRAFRSDRNDFLITSADYSALTTPIRAGDTIVDTSGFYWTGNRTVQSVTVNYLSYSSVNYTRIVLTSNPSNNSNNDTDISGLTVTSSIAATYNSAISTSRTDFLITQTQYSASTILNTDVLSATTVITGGQSISSITANYATVNSVSYARIIMTGVGNANSTSGSGNNVTVTATSAATNLYNRAINTGRTDFLITDTQYATSGIAIGDILSAATVITGSQTITTITPSYISLGGILHTRIIMSAAGNAASTAGAGNDVTVTVTAQGSAANYTSSSFLFFTSASWVASGATISTRIDSTETKFPAGTSVNSVSTRTFGATTVYRVGFTQASIGGAIAAAATVTFGFGAAFALPGEQVFSFVSNPGSTDTLQLTDLKELTSTTIGGRGTFPNGPDVLAINVYKVSGTATPVNIILRWSEAQA